jgi:membrane-associated phospholipid phosphatase
VPCVEPNLSAAPAPRAERTGCRVDGGRSADGRPTTSCPDRRPSGLVWDPDWPRFRLYEYIASGLFVAGALGSQAIPSREDAWTNPGAFDEWVRDRLRLGSPLARFRARDASDILFAFGVSHLVVDTVAVAWWGNGSGDVAWEMAMINVETLAFNALVNGVVSGLTSRERPYGRLCADAALADTDDCTSGKRYRSFFSGHTSTSFAIAGLICSHHANLPLYGGGALDTIGCGTAFMAASAVGVLRVVSDQHYASDVLTGAAVGAITGLGLPWLLHYRGGALSNDDQTVSDSAQGPSSVAVGVVPTPTGGMLWGRF